MTMKQKKVPRILLAAVLLLAALALVYEGVLYGALGAETRVAVGKGGAGRALELQRLAVFTPDREYSAVVLLDDYYTVETVQTLVDDLDLRVVNVWLWKPGETGRAMFAVGEDGDIAAAVRGGARRSLNDPGTSPEERRDLEKAANGQMGVFALTVQGAAKELNGVRGADKAVAGVDVEYNALAELRGKLWGRTVSYVYLPEKPDGAL